MFVESYNESRSSVYRSCDLSFRTISTVGLVTTLYFMQILGTIEQSIYIETILKKHSHKFRCYIKLHIANNVLEIRYTLFVIHYFLQITQTRQNDRIISKKYEHRTFHKRGSYIINQ